MPLKITIYGANCGKCNKLTERFRKVVADHQVDAVIEKITDDALMVKLNIYTLPAVIIEENVVSKGVLLSEKQIIRILNDFLPDDKKIPITTTGKKGNKRWIVILALFVIALVSILLWHFLAVPREGIDKNKATVPAKLSVADSLDLLYNYQKNKSTYKLTFLEFGSVGCVECKKMEKVMQQVRTRYNDRVNVVFYDVRMKENKKIVKHYGVEMIPVQVLLDRNGTEYFRHTGYFSPDSLAIKFNEHLNP
jgi:thioredoxin 1